jgi:class 3 adenylate cyclase/tetratricopeptide (TPR) repeat protein
MKKCSNCGEANLQRARFCMGCGSAVMAASRSEELRRVTVLFADIAGSTASISGMDPEAARAWLEPFVSRVKSAIGQCRGTVARIAGDGVKALFGAPIPLEEHALYACLAALRIQAEMADLSALDGRNGAKHVRIRIGINTGTVLLCSVATDLHVEYDAEGETTHLAAKAQQAAAPGSIVVTAEVAGLVAGLVETKPREPLRVAGLDQTVQLYELVGTTGASSRFEVAVRRGLTALVGRREELDVLGQSATRARSARSLVAMALVGEAGVGKSRILWEFRQLLLAQGWTVVAVAGTRGGTPVAFHAVLAVLRALFELHAVDDAHTVRAKLARFSGDGLDASALLVLLDRDPGDAGWRDQSSETRRGRIHKALVSALLAACARAPTAIVVDGWEEADPETRAFFGSFVRSTPAVPLLLLFEGRPTARPLFEQLPGIKFLMVQPLTAALGLLLFRTLAGNDPSLGRLEGEFLSRTAGNPFFLEEGLRMMVESGTLIGTPGGLRRSARRAEVTIPGSVADIVEFRIVRLPAGDRDTLKAAAVLGRDIPVALLRGLADVAPGELASQLSRLADSGLLVLDAEGRVEQYTFKHAVTQDVAYRLLKKSERVSAHGRLVKLLESPSFSAVADRVELLAHHCVRAQDWVRSLQYLRSAADRAADRSAPNEVVRLLDGALTALSQARPEDASADLEVDIRLSMAFPLVQLGNLTRTAQEVERLEALEPHCTDRGRQGQVAVFVCSQRWLSGEHRKALDIGRRALAIGAELDDPLILVPARQCVGGALHESGGFEEALSLLNANVESVAENTPGHPFGMAGLPAVFARATRCWVYEHLGRFDDAGHDGEEALRIAEANNHPFSLGSAAFALGALMLARGEAQSALPLFEEGVRRCEAGRLRLWRPVVGSMLALAYAQSGDVTRARAVIDRTVPRLDETVLMSSFTSLVIARTYAAISRHGEASQLVRRTLGRVRALGGRTWEAEALLAEGDFALDAPDGDIGAANLAYTQGLALAAELGMAPIAARCRLGLATVAARVGDAETARRHEETAVQALESINAPGLVNDWRARGGRA